MKKKGREGRPKLTCFTWFLTIMTLYTLGPNLQEYPNGFKKNEKNSVELSLFFYIFFLFYNI